MSDRIKRNRTRKLARTIMEKIFQPNNTAAKSLSQDSQSSSLIPSLTDSDLDEISEVYSDVLSDNCSEEDISAMEDYFFYENIDRLSRASATSMTVAIEYLLFVKSGLEPTSVEGKKYIAKMREQRNFRDSESFDDFDSIISDVNKIN